MNDVVTLTAEHGERAGELLAARHARERERFPLLPAAFEDPQRAGDLVVELLSFCNGVARFTGPGAGAGSETDAARTVPG